MPDLTPYDIARAIRKLRRNHAQAVAASSSPRYKTQQREEAKAVAYRSALRLLGVSVPSLDQIRKAAT